jgi:hypothetical protein
MPESSEHLPDIKAQNPSEVIQRAIDNRDWFFAFSSAVTFFELFGYWRLRQHCEYEKLYANRQIKKLGATNLALVLYLLQLIDQDTHVKITKVIESRDNFVHPISEGARLSSSYLSEGDAKAAEAVLQGSIVAIERIKKGLIEHTLHGTDKRLEG